MRPGPPPRPRKRLGQHFLSDPRILDRIVGALGLTGNETVIEVGPGRGALTDRLVAKCGRLIAVELDRDLVPMLRARYASHSHVLIAEGDVLDMSLAELAQGPYHLIGNIPYYITTPILFHALESPRPERAVFLVQKEVADRLAAAPASRDYGALTVNVQTVAKVESVFRVPAGAFNPPPKVDSAVIRVTPLANPVVTPEEETAFRRFVQACFAQRRKQLKAIVRAEAHVDTARAAELVTSCGIQPEARAETLSVEQFAVLFRAVKRE